jgi:hypothetical protein
VSVVYICKQLKRKFPIVVTVEEVPTKDTFLEIDISKMRPNIPEENDN